MNTQIEKTIAAILIAILIIAVGGITAAYMYWGIESTRIDKAISKANNEHRIRTHKKSSPFFKARPMTCPNLTVEDRDFHFYRCDQTDEEAIADKANWKWNWGSPYWAH